MISQLITICMWVWEQAEGRGSAQEGKKEPEEETVEADWRQLLAKEERLAMAITADLLAAFLSAALLPVYTLQTGKSCRQLLNVGRRSLIGGYLY
jgi:hypothetical protein